MDSLEYIDSYFAGEIPQEEASRFEKRIQEDPAFATEVAYYLGVRSALKEVNNTDRKARFRELYRQQGQPAKVRGFGPRKWLSLAAAAMLLTAIALSWLLFFKPADPPRLADRYIQQNLTVLPSKMGETDSLQTGINLYNSGSYGEALRQFEGLLRADSSNPTALLHAGIVALRLENYDKALYFFIRLGNHTDPHVNPALFYEALTLLKRNHAGDPDHAKLLLKRIVEEDLNKKRDAQELLSKM
jgi:tetratricopeptide (TPR) repeat protein